MFQYITSHVFNVKSSFKIIQYKSSFNLCTICKKVLKVFLNKLQKDANSMALNLHLFRFITLYNWTNNPFHKNL